MVPLNAQAEKQPDAHERQPKDGLEGEGLLKKYHFSEEGEKKGEDITQRHYQRYVCLP